MDIVIWHRPLAAYMQAFIAQELRLAFFDEPRPTGVPPEDAAKAERCERVPYVLVMEWSRPETAHA